MFSLLRFAFPFEEVGLSCGEKTVIFTEVLLLCECVEFVGGEILLGEGTFVFSLDDGCYGSCSGKYESGFG